MVVRQSHGYQFFQVGLERPPGKGIHFLEQHHVGVPYVFQIVCQASQ